MHLHFAHDVIHLQLTYIYIDLYNSSLYICKKLHTCKLAKFISTNLGPWMHVPVLIIITLLRICMLNLKEKWMYALYNGLRITD